MKRRDINVISLCLFCVVFLFGVKGMGMAKAEESISLTLNRTALVMKPGNTSTLVVTKAVFATGSAIFGEENGMDCDASSGASIVWSSSNSKVAAVNQRGKVTAKKAGTATITAKCGQASVSCRVRVAKN